MCGFPVEVLTNAAPEGGSFTARLIKPLESVSLSGDSSSSTASRLLIQKDIFTVERKFEELKAEFRSYRKFLPLFPTKI